MFQLAMLSIYAQFGDGPTQWGRQLRGASGILVFALIPPLYFLSALTGMAQPETVFSFAADPVRAVISIVTLAVIICWQLAGTLLLLANRALGIIVSIMGLLYFAPMVAALAIASAAMKSLWVMALTIALVVWSVYRLVRVERQRMPDIVQRVAVERLVSADSRLYLLPDSAIENGGLVMQEQTRIEGVAILLMFLLSGLSVALMIFALLITPALMPFLPVIPAMMWVICVGTFMAAGLSMNRFVLLWRAMKHAKEINRSYGSE